MAWTTPGTATAGDVLTAAFWNTQVRDNLNALPRGVVGRADSTSSYTIGTSLGDVTGITVTWTADSSRLYLVRFHAYGQKTTSTGFITLIISDGANNIKNQRDFSFDSATSYFGLEIELLETGLSGSTTRKIRASASTGTQSLPGSSTYPMQIYVMDVGPA